MFSQLHKISNCVLAASKLLGSSCTPLRKPTLSAVAHLRTTSFPNSRLKTQKEYVSEEVAEDNEQSQAIISKVNEQIQQKSHGRLFAVIWLMGKQYKITDEDILAIEGFWPPTVGDKLKMEKVLLVGGSDFTLIGTPILSRDLVSVTATVIEKKMGVIKTRFRKMPRKQYERTRFVRKDQTMLRINKVEALDLVGESKDIIGAPRAV